MYQFILIIHMFACIAIVGLVLVQQGKGATMGAAFGSGASQTVFGSRGSGSFLLKVTAAFVGIFFATSITLNHMATKAVKLERAATILPSDSIPASVSPSSIPSSSASIPQPTTK
jgi:preprotein translocase subunit SecG